MDKIYSPWRHDYVTKTDKSLSSNGSKCVFCLAKTPNQKDLFILKSLDHCYVTLNIYPYSTGHILIIPFEHGGELYQLPKKTTTEVFLVAGETMKILKNAVAAQGFNLGLNVGSAGGSGIRDHSHVHVVPRWEGDTNFMVSSASTKVICSDIEKTFQALQPLFKNLSTKS